jgi:hypothetical protein
MLRKEKGWHLILLATIAVAHFQAANPLLQANQLLFASTSTPFGVTTFDTVLDTACP